MKRVFICSKLTPHLDKTEADHMDDARMYSRHVVENNLGAPFTPHLMYPQYLDDTMPREREAGIMAGITYLEVCDELYVFLDESEHVSTGMRAEIQKAKAIDIPVRTFKKEDNQIVEIKKTASDIYG